MDSRPSATLPAASAPPGVDPWVLAWDGFVDVEATLDRLRVSVDRDRPEAVPIRVGGTWREVPSDGTVELST